MFIAMIFLGIGFIAWTLIPLFFTDAMPTTPPAILLVFTFVLATRNSIVSLLTGISYESQLILHKYCSYISIITGFMHGVDDIYFDDFQDKFTGLTLFAAMYFLILSGILFKFFKKLFELFLRFHYILFLVVFVFGIMHGVWHLRYAVIILGLDYLIRVSLISYYQLGSNKAEIKLIAKDVI